MTTPFTDLIPLPGKAGETPADPFGDLVPGTAAPTDPSGYGLLEAMAHAATLGTSGPLTALTHALLMKHVNGDPRPLGELYGEAVTQGQGKREAYEAQQSTPGAIAEGAAGMLPFMALPEAAGVGKSAGLVRTVLEGGAKAAGVGGAAAAIRAASDAPVGQAPEAAVEALGPGALVGGMVGAALGPLGKLGKFAASRTGAGKAAAAKREIATALGLSEGEMKGAEQHVIDKMTAGEPVTLAQLHPTVAKQVLTDIAEKSSQPTRVAMGKFIDQQATQVAKPLYDKALPQVFRATTPEAKAALANPEMMNALDVARGRLAREGVALPPQPNPAILAAARQMQQRNPALLNSPSNAAFKQALQQADDVPVVLVDRAKQVLDKTIHRRPKDTDELKVLAATKQHLNDLLDAVDAQVPEYGQARAVAATYKQLGDAVRAASKARVTGVTQGGGIAGKLRPFDIRSPQYGLAHAAVSGLEALSPRNAERLGPDFLKLLLTGSGGQLGGQSLGGPQELLGLLQTLRNLPAQPGVSTLIPGVGGYAGSRVGGQ